MFNKRPRPLKNLCIVDCLAGKRAMVASSPFVIGSSQTSDLRMGTGGEDHVILRISKMNDTYHLQPGSGAGSLIFDGEDALIAEISDDTEHTVVARGYPFVLRLGNDEPQGWLHSINPENWLVYRRPAQEWKGPVNRNELPLMIGGAPGDIILMCEGMEHMGFYPHQIMSRMVTTETNGFNGRAVAQKSYRHGIH